MAKIPLRQYNREIETLIDRGQTEEAIAHCRYILQTYPKYIEAYRLLGKAFLESQRFGEAADIFQRVLACVPDDFVSQIGMSIIREDEGNLDAALWHMERAFEVQPANSAVQGELRRLYGRRDGLEPPKIRLTRGALVRMYARGDLYQQAIAECRVALADDPQRPDLQGIMARMHALAGQKVEAADICSSILAKYPYNFEANRILSEILPGTARAEDSQAYKQRIVALEPYLGLLPPDSIHVTEVPDNAVMVDRLDWNPLEGAAPNQPQWAESLGIQFQQPADQETMPEWLSPRPETEQTSLAETTSEFQAPQEVLDEPPAGMQDIPGLAAETDENQIPDWMKDAGWVPSDGTIPEQPAAYAEPEEIEDALAPADIPDWLLDMAPEESSDQPSEPASMGLAVEDIAPTAPTSEDLEGIPDWLENFGTESVEPSTTSEPQLADSKTGAEEFDWLKDFESSAQPGISSPEVNETALENLTEDHQPDTLPDWLAGTIETPEQTEEQVISETEADTPETPANLEHAGEIPGQVFAPVDDTEQDAALAWLESLAAKHGADEEVLFTRPEDRADTPPDWVQEAADAAPPTALEPQATDVSEWLNSLDTPEGVETASPDQPGQMPELLPAQHAPAIDWGAEIFSADVDVTRVETAQPEPSAADQEMPAWLTGEAHSETADTGEALPAQDIPDWLAGLAPIGAAETEQEPAGLVDETPAAPSWIEETLPEQSADLPEEIEQPHIPQSEEIDLVSIEESSSPELHPAPEAEQLLPAQTPLPDLNDQDAALAWLESLAAKQGADEEVLFTKPEERTETPPDWVLEQPAVEAPVVQTGQQVINEDQSAPEISQPDASAEEAAVGSVESLQSEPDWLADLTVQESEPEDTPTPSSQNFEPPAWLKEEEIAQAASSTTQPEWLAEGEPEAEPDLEPGVLPAWLQGMKEEQQAAREPLVEEPVENPTDDLAGWLQGLQTQDTEAEQPLQTADAPAADAAAETDKAVKLPEWLKQYEEPPSEGTPIQHPVIPSWVDEVEAETSQQTLAAEPESAVQDSTVQPETPVPPQTYTQPLQSSTPEFPIVEKIPVQALEDAELAELQPVLSNAQNHLFSGQIPQAVQEYDQLIQSGAFLQETIHDLREALYRYPVEISIWEKLGDAYARANQLQEALDAYTKAEELLR